MPVSVPGAVVLMLPLFRLEGVLAVREVEEEDEDEDEVEVVVEEREEEDDDGEDKVDEREVNVAEILRLPVGLVVLLLLLPGAVVEEAEGLDPEGGGRLTPGPGGRVKFDEDVVELVQVVSTGGEGKGAVALTLLLAPAETVEVRVAVPLALGEIVPVPVPSPGPARVADGELG